MTDTRRKVHSRDTMIIVASIVTGAAIFSFDLLIPLGVAAGVPYVGLVLISLYSSWRHYAIVLAIAGTVLTALGYFLSPSLGILWVVITNRLLAVFLIWLTAEFCRRRMQAEEALSRSGKLLEKSNQQLLRKNKELDEFSYIASHDLQEPLRKILSFSDLLRKDIGEKLPERAETDLDYITDAAARMSTLITHLLELSRAGAKALKMDWVSLNDCVNDALELLETHIETRKAVIRYAELPMVWGDRAMLGQLYLNLIGNSLKFVPKDRTPNIHLTVETDGDLLIFGIQDNGIGIKPEYLEKIFMPFKRLHRRLDYEGTGIGLSICLKVIERHGGRIWVESTPEEGAHFRFTLDTKIRNDKETTYATDHYKTSSHFTC